MDEELTVAAVDGPDCALVTLSGPLSLRTLPQISGELGKALVNRGCVAADLSGLRLEWEPGVTIFTTVLAYAGGWPTARMVLFGADRELAAALDRSRVTQTVPLAADLEAALQRVQRRPERVRRHRDLPPEPTAAPAARALVRRACVDWEIPIGTEHTAALIISELAVNAAVHACTPLRVSVGLAGTVLSVSVRDLRPDLPPRFIPRVPDLAAGPDRAPRLAGLRLVSAVASKWGVNEQPDSKTIWAQLPPPSVATDAEAEQLTTQHPALSNLPDH